MAPRLLSRAALARLAGVSAMAITKACRKALAPACVADRVDLDHPTVRTYLEGKGVDAAKVAAAHPAAPAMAARPKSAPKTRGRKPAAPAPSSKAPRAGLRPSRRGAQRPGASVAPAIDVDAPPADRIEEWADLTLRELVEQHGTDRRFRDWLDALKKIEDIRKTRLDNDETEGRLIARELVRTHVFGAIENAFRRLLMDTPKTLVRRLYAAAKSGTSIEEAETLLRDSIGSQLKPVKATAARVLRGGAK